MHDVHDDLGHCLALAPENWLTCTVYIRRRNAGAKSVKEMNGLLDN